LLISFILFIFSITIGKDPLPSGKKRGQAGFARIYEINPLYLLHGKEPKFLEKESKNKNGFRSIVDTSGNLEEFIWFLHHSPMVQFAALEFFTRYKVHNMKDIEQDVIFHKDKKLK
jgi:hypothetical protein